MIFVFVIIALCGVTSGDVSEIIKPSREYLPPSRGYLPPVLTKLLVTSTGVPAFTTLPSVRRQDAEIKSTVASEISQTTAQQTLLPNPTQYIAVQGTVEPELPKTTGQSSAEQGIPSTIEPLITKTTLQPTLTPIIVQGVGIQSTLAPETLQTVVPALSEKLILEKEITTSSSITVAPVTDTVSIQRQYLPPLSVKSVVPKIPEVIVQEKYLPPIPSIATPNEIKIQSNANGDDLELLTNIISQPTLDTVDVPQTPGIITSNSISTTIASQPSVVTFVPESTPHSIATQPTTVPEYIQTTGSLSSEATSQSDPLIRINASELLEGLDQISELPSTVVEVSAPDTILSEDGYHYSIPLISFGSVSKK